MTTTADTTPPGSNEGVEAKYVFGGEETGEPPPPPPPTTTTTTTTGVSIWDNKLAGSNSDGCEEAPLLVFWVFPI